MCVGKLSPGRFGSAVRVVLEGCVRVGLGALVWVGGPCIYMHKSCKPCNQKLYRELRYTEIKKN